MEDPAMTRLTTLLSILLIAVQALASSQAPPPPPSPDPLMPAAPTAVMTVRSLDAVHDLWAEITAMTGGDHDVDALHAALTEGIPGFADMVDFGLPMAMTMTMPPVMLPQEPMATYLLPLLPSVTDVSPYVDMNDVAAVLVRDGYAALSTDPDYAPAVDVPDLASDMLDGLISASADMEGLFKANRAVIEMGLASAPMAAAMADSTGEAEVTQEQIVVMTDLARLLLDSLRRIDMSIDMIDGDMVVRTRTGMIPDSPMDFGPQPDFSEALALTRLLPPGALIVQAHAVDLGDVQETINGLSSLSMDDLQLKLDDARDPDAFAEWWMRYQEILKTETKITASAVRMDDGKFAASTAVKVDDPDAVLADLVALCDEFITMAPEFGLERLPDGETGGARVYGWTMDFETMVRGMAGAEQDVATHEQEELCRVLALLSSVSSEFRMCTRDGVLMFSMDDDSDGIAEMVRALNGGHARIDPRAAALAARSGPDCREICYGDVGAIMNWALGMVPEAETVTMGPVEFASFTRMNGPESASELVVDMEGIRSFAAFIETMETLEGNEGHGH